MTFSEVNALLYAILDEAPADRTSLGLVLRSLPLSDRNFLREAVVRRLDAAVAPNPGDLALLGELLTRLGIGGVVAALGLLVVNPAREPSVRLVAAEALAAAGADFPDPARLFTDLARGQIEGAADPGAFLAEMVAARLPQAVPGEAEAAVVSVADRVRRELGRTYVEYFLPLIKGTGKSPEPLDAPLVAALVAAAEGETDPETLAALELLMARGVRRRRPPARGAAPASRSRGRAK